MKRISAPELSAEQRASFIFLFNKHNTATTTATTATTKNIYK